MQRNDYSFDKAAKLCGLVLAGGEGERLRSFVKRLRGDDLPKQYVKFTGSGSMLEHTYRRAEKLIARERLFTVVNQAHLNYPEVQDQLRPRHPGTVVVQPFNRETGPGLLLPLTYLNKRHPNAAVAVFPSDQFIREPDLLSKHIQVAHALVARNPSVLVLLGVKPDEAEPDYGYIVPTSGAINGSGVQSVQAFIEKPSVSRAKALIADGALWNTMLMVFSAGAFFHWVHELQPALYYQFAQIYSVIGSSTESAAVQATYNKLGKVNFSKQLLEPLARQYPERVILLPVTDLTWSDWGSERRIRNSLKSIGKIPCGMQAKARPEGQRAPDKSVYPESRAAIAS